MPSQRATLLFGVPTPGLARRDVLAFAQRLAQEVAGGRTFECLITGDDELRRLNKQFRKKDYPADVLSFPAGSSSCSLGEIAISYHRAKDQAEEHGHKTAQEIDILMLHGVLHLIGMDHETDRGRMSRAEKRWRSLLGLPPGLIERVRA